MSTSMSLGPVLGRNDVILKRQFRWMIAIGAGRQDRNGIGGVVGNTANVLPPLRGSRPGLSIKEIEIEHVSETIYMPGKASWKPLRIAVYDVATNVGNNLVFDWISRYYHAQNASYGFVSSGNNVPNFKKTATISLYDGAGCCLENWTLENCWPKDIEWGELNMASSDVVLVEMELRFDRAFISSTCLDAGTGSCT